VLGTMLEGQKREDVGVFKTWEEKARKSRGGAREERTIGTTLGSEPERNLLVWINAQVDHSLHIQDSENSPTANQPDTRSIF